jgi:hypothetical protein
MLSPMMVFLLTKTSASLKLGTLHLKSAYFVDTVIPTPLKMNLAMHGALFSARCTQFVDDVLDVPTARFVRN